jgi:predicted permease
MFDAENQKFVANLNVALFTPCLSMQILCIDEKAREADPQ